MTLRTKLLLALAALQAGLIAVLLCASHLLLLRSFIDLERDEAVRAVTAGRNALQQELEAIGVIAGDYAPWDETWNFIATADPAYLKANLQDSVLANLRLHRMFFLDLSGRLVHAVGFDPETKRAVPVDEAEKAAVAALAVRTWTDPAEQRSFVLDLPGGPFLAALRPIVRTGGVGPIRGTIIAARRLDAPALGEILGLSLTAHLDGAALPDDFREARARLAPGGPPTVHHLAHDRVAAYLALPATESGPGIILRTDQSCRIHRQGEFTVYGFIALLLFFGLAFILITLVFFERYALRRLTALTEGIVNIGHRRDPTARLPAMGEDELGRLATRTNELLAGLEAAQREREKLVVQMEEASRLRSMGRMAAGVAHEINTPLNNLALTLSGLQVLLEKNPETPTATLLQRLGRTAGEIGRIQEILDHMRGLVARPEEVRIIPVDLAATVRRGLGLVEARLAARRIAVADELPAGLPPVRADARQLEQAVLHLVNNALDALETLPPEAPRRLRLSARAVGGAVAFEIADSGPGLGATADRIFEPFFSTKETGHGMGLGLALVHGHVAAWGARIRAGTAPEGGALFTLDFPPAEPDHAHPPRR